MTAEPTRQDRRELRRRLKKTMRRFLEDPRHDVPRQCNMCGYHGPFSVHGSPPRFGARCPRCGSLDRHRLFVLGWTSGAYALPDAPRVLHFAPEAALGSFIREGAVEYVTADLMRDDVDLKINIEDIDLPDASFEVIVCNHVLEHVNTPLALTELYRILVPGGTALLSFPIEEGMAETYRNPEVTTDFERLLHFGQRDHVLSFGTDIREMIRGAGFGLSEFATPPERHVDMGLALGSRIFIAKKAA